MQGIQFTYTQTYNRHHRTIGHLFRGRYKAILCDRNEYLFELVRYINLNPARMRKSIDPWTYRWSGHRGYMGEKSEIRLETEAMLGQFGKSRGHARRGYVRFMEEGAGGGHEEKYYQATNQRFLRDEVFVESVAARTTENDIKPAGPRASFQRLLAAVMNEYGVTKERLLGTGRQRDWIGQESS
jgi:putative transposase